MELDTEIPTAEEILIADKYMREEVLNSEDKRNNNHVKNVGKICADSPKPAGIYRKEEQCCHNDIEPIPKIEMYERSREFVCIASFDNYIQKALLIF